MSKLNLCINHKPECTTHYYAEHLCDYCKLLKRCEQKDEEIKQLEAKLLTGTERAELMQRVACANAYILAETDEDNGKYPNAETQVSILYAIKNKR